MIDLIPKSTQINLLCQQHQVLSLDIFGSALSDRFNERSDVDLLVRFDAALAVEEYADNYFSLYYALQDLFGRKVDLINERSLSNPYFVEEVNRTKKRIYGAAN